MNILLDGIFVLQKDWRIVFAIVALVLLGCAPVLSLLPRMKRGNRGIYLFLTLFTLLSLVLRLAYIRNIFVPQYFDSVAHVRISRIILNGIQSSTFFKSISEAVPTYYHIGFHLIISFLAFALNVDIIRLVLVFGQIILALLPVPVFFFVWLESNSKRAAFLSALLASFTWYMPGFAINWGKYPMLTGLFFGEVVLFYAYTLRFSKKKIHSHSVLFFFFLVVGILVTLATHSRMFFFLLVSGISYFLASKSIKLPRLHQFSIIVGSILSILVLGALIYQDALLQLTLEPYCSSQGRNYTALILLLSLFALKKFPRWFYYTLFFISGIFLCLFIPADKFFNISNQTLLDRPFVETILYFPLALMGGLGFAGFSEEIKKRFFQKKRLVDLILFFTLGFSTFFLLKNYQFYPSPCCTLVESSDISAMEWIMQNLSGNAKILVAADLLEVVPKTKTNILVGSDAGVWIPYLTGREAVPYLYSSDFSSSQKRRLLCQDKIDYVYLGSKALSFNQTLINSPKWYKEILSLSGVRLYAVTGCSQ